MKLAKPAAGVLVLMLVKLVVNLAVTEKLVDLLLPVVAETVDLELDLVVGLLSGEFDVQEAVAEVAVQKDLEGHGHIDVVDLVAAEVCLLALETQKHCSLSESLQVLENMPLNLDPGVCKEHMRKLPRNVKA